MNPKKLETLKNTLKSYEKVAVAVSGGSDSTLLMALATEILGPGKVTAFTAKRTFDAPGEAKRAIEFSEKLGVKHVMIEGTEIEPDELLSNPPRRCYICKRALFEKALQIFPEKEGYKILDGSIADDLDEHRPGSKALVELGVKSPLQEAGFTKEDVRNLSREKNLSSAEYPSEACLLTRFPEGAKITVDKLDLVARAEEKIRSLGFERELRVRLPGDSARVEVSPTELSRLNSPRIARQITEELNKLGIEEVQIDSKGYRTGSMEKEKLKKAIEQAAKNKPTFAERNGLALLSLVFIVCGWAAVGISLLIKSMPGETWAILQVAPAFVVVVLFIGATLMAGRLLFVRDSSKGLAALATLLSAGSLAVALIAI